MVSRRTKRMHAPTPILVASFRRGPVDAEGEEVGDWRVLFRGLVVGCVVISEEVENIVGFVSKDVFVLEVVGVGVVGLDV
jgi:hypothetical protein